MSRGVSLDECECECKCVYMVDTYGRRSGLTGWDGMDLGYSDSSNERTERVQAIHC